MSVINPTNTFASTLTYHSCSDGTLGVVCWCPPEGGVHNGYYYCDHCKTDLGEGSDTDTDTDTDEE